MIKATGVYKIFTTDAGELEVLRGINLHIKAGEFVGIVGASGAGKSTLLHILGTLDNPTSGTIEIDSQDTASMSAGKLTTFRNSTVGFVFQFHHLLPEFSAMENVMMPALIGGLGHTEAKTRAGELLSGLGLSDRDSHRPGELSGGEQQRVAVARALVMEPKIILADEPTGNLDTSTGNRLFELLHELNRKMGTTFVIVTHNDTLSSSCHRVIEMIDGEIKKEAGQD